MNDNNNIILTGVAPKVEFLAYNTLSDSVKELIEQAIQTRDKWNQPVSRFHVGAAIEVEGCNNKIYTWSNFENVNFNGTTHAEQAAVTSALIDRLEVDINTYDNMNIKKLVVVWWMKDVVFNPIIFEAEKNIAEVLGTNPSIDKILSTFVTPCGHCRQIYHPFIWVDTSIYLMRPDGLVANIRNPKTLLPFAFTKIG